MKTAQWRCPDCQTEFISEDKNSLATAEKEIIAIQFQHMLSCYVTNDEHGKPRDDEESKPSGSNN